jgi:hypothetical protein
MSDLTVDGTIWIKGMALGASHDYPIDIRPLIPARIPGDDEPIFIMPHWEMGTSGAMVRFQADEVSSKTDGQIGATTSDFSKSAADVTDIHYGHAESARGGMLWCLDFHTMRRKGPQATMRTVELEVTTDVPLESHHPNAAVGVYTQGEERAGIVVEAVDRVDLGDGGYAGSGWNWILNHRITWDQGPFKFPDWSGIDGWGNAYFRRIKISDEPEFGNAQANAMAEIYSQFERWPALNIKSGIKEGGSQVKLFNWRNEFWSIYNEGSVNELRFWDTEDRMIISRERVKVLNVLNVNAPECADNAAAIGMKLKPGDVYRTGDFLKIVH